MLGIKTGSAQISQDLGGDFSYFKTQELSELKLGLVMDLTILSNSHPRRILGVDFTFAWSQEEEQEGAPPKFS